MLLKNFVVFEGIDGAGTSTQIEALKRRAEAASFSFTAEPTGLPTGKFLRQMLKGDVTLDARTAAYLFAADRAEHVWGAGGIAEQCAADTIVVSDRYLFSSLAYQCVTCGEELPRLLNAPFPLPQLLFFFKIDAETALARVQARNGAREIYETADFLRQTEARYEAIISEYAEASARGAADGRTGTAGASTGAGDASTTHGENPTGARGALAGAVNRPGINTGKPAGAGGAVSARGDNPTGARGGMNIVVLDASLPAAEVSKIIWDELQKLPIIKR